jgi:nitroimidazol reductase NimA-like FMN-containing flavoprotein (pyridoxamine 5'-phosphate oxidase superfamily)
MITKLIRGKILVKYHMKRKEKEITDGSEIRNILKQQKFTTISMCHENEPYLVTLSYGYDESKNAFYFHCAKEGQKIDFIKANPYVCGTVIEDNGYAPDCGQVFRSVVYRGKFTIIEDLQEKIYGFDILLNQLEADPITVKEKFLKKKETYENSGMLRLDIEDLSCKEEKAGS